MASPFEVTKKVQKGSKSVIYCHLWCTCFMQLILSWEREMVDKIQAILFFMQFSTIVGGDENWRMQTKKNLVVPSSMK
jgi:hypothetical protein